MTKVKICGIRSLEAAQTAVKEGADFLGFNFVVSSKRYIDPSSASKIINKFKKRVKIVGVFQNDDLNYVRQIAAQLKLDFVQLHGKENNHYINNVGLPVIKYFSFSDQPQKINATYLLLDRKKQGQGKMINVEKATKLALNYALFYAGGLTPQNVAEVIKSVQPFAVDISSGIETNGIQDIEKIKDFIKNAKGVK